MLYMHYVDLAVNALVMLLDKISSTKLSLSILKTVINS